MEMGGKRHALTALPPVKTWYPLNGRMCGPQGQSGEVLKISPPRGFDTQTVQPVVTIPTSLSQSSIWYWYDINFSS